MMAAITMTIWEMMNNPLTPIFPDEYPFYTDDEQARKEFEELFKLHFLTRQIEFETPYLFQMKLKGRLMEIMPYYRQLAMTEWEKVRTSEQMMTSKDLSETTEHTQTLSGTNESSLTSNQSITSENTQNSSQTVSGESSSTSENNQIMSNLSDGVSSVSLDDGYLTGKAKTNQSDSGTNTQTSSVESTLAGTDTTTGKQSGTSSNEQTLTEKTTFTSKGDVGIQTPAYAIGEWRRVIININQLILKECECLFLKIY